MDSVLINSRSFKVLSSFPYGAETAHKLSERGFEAKGYVVAPAQNGVAYLAYRTLDGRYVIP